MNVYVMDGLQGISSIVEIFESLIWNIQFFEIGDFQMIVPYSEEMDRILAIGKYLVRDVDVSDREYHNVMIIRNRIISFDADKGWTLEVSGSGLKSLLSQRIIWEQMNFEQENVEEAIRQAVTDNALSPSDPDRAFIGLTIAPTIGFTDVFDAQIFSENLAEWISATCTVYGYGWDIFIRNGEYVFTLIEGTDRSIDSAAPVIFSEEFENIASMQYTCDRSEYHNVGLVGGEGEGDSQIVESVGSAIGFDRYETYIDGGEVSSNGEIITLETYKSMLVTYGQEQLTADQFVEKFEGEILPNSQYEFGVDYFLGDIVEVSFKGIRAKSRIIEMIYSEDANGSTLLPTFSDWEVNT